VNLKRTSLLLRKSPFLLSVEPRLSVEGLPNATAAIRKPRLSCFPIENHRLVEALPKATAAVQELRLSCLSIENRLSVEALPEATQVLQEPHLSYLSIEAFPEAAAATPKTRQYMFPDATAVQKLRLARLRLSVELRHSAEPYLLVESRLKVEAFQEAARVHRFWSQGTRRSGIEWPSTSLLAVRFLFVEPKKRCMRLKMIALSIPSAHRVDHSCTASTSPAWFSAPRADRSAWWKRNPPHATSPRDWVSV
jgi:hypothetical protein